MRGLNRIVVVLFLAALTVSAETTTSEFTWTDGNTYVHTYTYDEVTGSSYERHDLVLADGSTELVASLFSDVDGNWTGSLYGDSYADQYDEILGDYEVVVGADLWPTWSDFDAALAAVGFWDGAVYDGGGIVIDDGIYYDIMVLSIASTESSDGTTSTTRSRGLQNALSRVAEHASAMARTRVLRSLNVGRGTPPSGNGH